MKITTTILALFIALCSTAQWTTDTDVNTLVADSTSGDMQAIATSDGKTYVVFWKVVSAPVNYELRLQILDVDGTQMLGSDGMLVSNTIPMSTYTVIWSIVTDANDNLYIGVTGTGAGAPAYVFKLDSTGNQLWGTNGVNVGSGYSVTVLPLSTGDAIVSWSPSGQSLMQKYDASGNAVWGTTQAIVNGANPTVPANMFELSSGDYIMVFHSVTYGINSNLYAQRYNSTGVLQWGAPTQLSNLGTVFNTSYSGVQDGDVVYMGYKASPALRFDSYLQRINADGTLPWGINGSDFDTNQTNYEMGTRIAFSQGSSYVWAICTYTNPNQTERGEYVQKFDKDTGSRQLTDNAKLVYAIGSEKVHAASLQLKDDSPLFLMKSGIDNGVSPITLGVVFLDSDGDFVWTEESKPVATFSANKSRINYTKPVNNQSVAVFIEEKSVEPKIYAQNFLDEDLSTDEFGNEIVTITYTNPIEDTLTIESDFNIESIFVYNVSGQKMYNKSYQGMKEIAVSTANWYSGIYFMTIKTTDNGFVKGLKIIKN